MVRRNTKNNQKYNRRHGLGESTDCGNRDKIKSLFWNGQLVQQQKNCLQVHIRTSPNASPENVGVFVGSDPTDPAEINIRYAEPVKNQKNRGFTSLQMCHTHTCSETAYRITDVECIARAKTPQLNLTGNGEWLGARNSVDENFLRPC